MSKKIDNALSINMNKVDSALSINTNKVNSALSINTNKVDSALSINTNKVDYALVMIAVWKCIFCFRMARADPYADIDFDDVTEATGLAIDEIKCLKV